MTREEFEGIVAATLEEIESAFPDCLDNVAVCVEERCGRVAKNAVKLRRGDTLMGLYEGVPLSERSYNEAWMMPDKITLFIQPVLAEARFTGRDPAGLIREVVWHEVGHLVGLDENRARAAEKRRRES
jgi:predicted Zn-dependent protease with MMP-like domain